LGISDKIVDIREYRFVERKHAEDVLKRVLVYFDTWI
jgi:hypothetical protein